MVFVKVRETYDLQTTKNKMTVISIHTPKPDIIKRNYPGLLMQCRAYRPVSADVRIACASVMPLDPLGIGTQDGDVAPEDIFNPILYKAISNKGMSQLEARINYLSNTGTGVDVVGQTADVDVDSFTGMQTDEFGVYYGLLSNTHDWKHANPQSGLEMKGLRPLVYEMVYNVGDAAGPINPDAVGSNGAHSPSNDGTYDTNPVIPVRGILGKAKEFPFLNCTDFSYYQSAAKTNHGEAIAGFDGSYMPYNAEQTVPYLNVVCGCIIVPPSRLHTLFYRLICEWTLEFTALRPISEIENFSGLQAYGSASHFFNYSYAATKEAITGSSESLLTSDACMVSSNVDVNKVM